MSLGIDVASTLGGAQRWLSMKRVVECVLLEDSSSIEA